MSCRGKAMHALGECDCYFTPLHFLALLEKERQWFEILLRFSSLGFEHAVTVMLHSRTWWLRN